MKTWPSALRVLSVVVVASLAVACAAATIPTPRPAPRVGFMHVGTDHNPPSLATLVAGLGDLGWFDGSSAPVMQQLIGDGTLVDGKMKQVQGEYDGQRIQLIWRNLEGKDQAEQQAKEFVRERVDLIVAFEDKSIAAAQDATADPANRIPVVFLHPSDPVRDGLVDSLAHPGGNLTGAFGARDPVAKQLEIYREILPDKKPLRLLTLVDPTDNPATPPPSSGSSSTNTRRPTTPVSQRRSSRSRPDRSTACSSCRPACDSTTRGRSLAWPLRRTYRSRLIARNGSTPRRSTRERSSRMGSTSRRSGPPGHGSSTAS
jgi:hypothetical protein